MRDDDFVTVILDIIELDIPFEIEEMHYDSS